MRRAIFSVSMDLVRVMTALRRLEIYNLTLRLLRSLLSLVFYSSKRCLFDSSNMARLYGHPVDMDTFYGPSRVYVLTGLCCAIVV